MDYRDTDTTEDEHETRFRNKSSDLEQMNGDMDPPPRFEQVISSGRNGEYVHIGGARYLKTDLLQAFGGTLNPGLSTPPSRKFGNPGPLGLSAFALTTFILSLLNCQAMGVTTSALIVGPAMFYGGIIQLLAGMWELALENTFGGLALSSYGGFWMSFAAINIPWFGVADAYADSPRDLQVSIGFFLLGWTLFTGMLIVLTMKSTFAFCGLFVFLTFTFLMLTLGELCDSTNCTKAGGVLGVITAFFAWYNAFAGVANKQNSYITFSGVQIPVYHSQKAE